MDSPHNDRSFCCEDYITACAMYINQVQPCANRCVFVLHCIFTIETCIWQCHSLTEFSSSRWRLHTHAHMFSFHPLFPPQESISDFYWFYSGKAVIDNHGRQSFSKAISAAKQVFNTLTEYIQVSRWPLLPRIRPPSPGFGTVPMYPCPVFLTQLCLIIIIISAKLKLLPMQS